MRHYSTALKNAGYDVTVLDTSNEKPKQYPGVSVKQFYIPPDFSGRKEAIIRFLTKPYNGFSMVNAQVDGNKFMMELIEQKWGELSALLATPYDLIVIDDIPCVHCAVISSVLNRIHGSKVVLFSTTKPLDYNMILLGLTKSIAISPYIFTVMPRNSDDIMDFRKFKDRISNIKLWVYEIYGFLMTDEASTISSANYLGLPAFQWSSFYQKIGLSVIESIDYNIWPIPTLPMIKHTGIHCERPNFSKIPQDLKVFIEDPASKGTIYIAFGSYIDFTYAPEHLIEALVNGVQRLSEYRVVVSVKINGTKIAKQPYVRYVEWSPQIEILSHPKTKAFLTHGGLKSTKLA
ncbi:unnamed protein product [Bursaphelenchus xylophilus]|uniref:glucuronosyltransferase n=1 Tax=Bursaphelenchus xylophilus TaxID=6326 RepID=A0A811M9Q2_BURXY|nr:unnamed protein product [Bursaphelenchus xylophilus]CAG9132268.1 unnamed protein product [Bursaphelenchus xylophilus]